MFGQFVSTLKNDARAAARAAAFSALGGLFALVGLGFLTLALWLVLTSVESATFAATVIGVLYAAAAFILLAFGASGRRKGAEPSPQDRDAHTPREPFVQMAEGFAMGMQAGRSARNDRH